MLKSISIQNIILIDKLNIDFGSGLCALTGETGAGKSILLDALSFALGRRASAKLLKYGCDLGSVTVTFSNDDKIIAEILSENSLTGDDELYLRRTIDKSGKSKAFINDTPVSVKLLQKISDPLIEIHGQHEQQNLFDIKIAREIIDSYGKINLKKLSDSFEKYKNLQNKCAELEDLKHSSESEIDYLSFVVKELAELSPELGEEEELAEKRKKLMNREKILDSLKEAEILLLDNDLAGKISHSEAILNKFPEFENIAKSLEQASIEINSALNDLEKISTDIASEDNDLEKIEARLFALKAVARKYNVSVDDLNNYRDEMHEKLKSINISEDDLNKIKQELKTSRVQFLQIAKEVENLRRKSASQIEENICRELAPLKMGSTKFKVLIEEVEEEKWSKYGVNKLSFLASTNSNQPMQTITKIASGGELSRFMLAFKVVLSEISKTGTMIFDEIDTGIGGATASSVGKRLHLLSKNTQLLVVTHQPQVASFADNHYRVEKIEGSNGTLTKVVQLRDEQRKEEIARMLSGDEVTLEARAAAVRLVSGV